MPELFVFLLKVNVALIAFCAGYFLVLRRLTFYTLNRAYLIIAILFSSVYPLIDVNSFAMRHEQIAPVQNVIVSWKAPAETLVKPLIDYWYWTEAIFWLGAVVFAVRLLVQLVSLFRLYRRSTPTVIHDHAVRVVDEDISPFSFWQSIFINPDNLKPADLKSVLQHEQVHVKEWHTLDVLLTEISVIFYWFNPGVWLMKKAVRENIEFITDRKILQQGVNTKEYQYSLLNVSVATTTSTGIINHFNFSTLKKRIKMMNAKRSSNANLTRYAFLVPTVVILLFVVSLSKAELVKQTKVAYKTIAASVQKLDIVTTAKPVKQAETKKAARARLVDTNKKVVNISRIIIDGVKTTAPGQDVKVLNFNTNSNDTGKRVITIITNRNGNDSTETYMVNGKKVSKEEFKKLAPGDIATINIIGDGPGDKRISKLRLNGRNINLSKDSAGNVTYFHLDTGKRFLNIVRGSNLNTNGGRSLIITKDLAAKNRVRLNDVYYSYNTNNEQNIDNFNERLIIIDGKEADEKAMKKLPASDIESINVKRGNEMVDKYGDKARKGVLFITTKKAKK